MDCSKLTDEALASYAEFYNIQLPARAKRSTVLRAVSRHFKLESSTPTMVAQAEKILSEFVSCKNASKYSTSEPPSKRHRPNRQAASRRTTGNELFGPAKVDEQVAAKIDGADATWILATVKKYHPSSDEFDVIDEDDDTKLIRLSRARVVRLDENVDQLNKGDSVLAVFPDTTSFYRGRVSKPIKNKPVSAGGDQAVYVQFEDDEDDTGRLPHRRIASRYVMPDPDDLSHSEIDLDECLAAQPPLYDKLIIYALQQFDPQTPVSSAEICDMLQDQIQDYFTKMGLKLPNWRGSIRRALTAPSSSFVQVQPNMYTLYHPNE